TLLAIIVRPEQITSVEWLPRHAHPVRVVEDAVNLVRNSKTLGVIAVASAQCIRQLPDLLHRVRGQHEINLPARR
ncbi:MAG: hypothetical protein KGI54_06950, partial [Pseudomonadota bacterium]|nr:hypothetical protein [Pseudomonadota bacterium]